MSGREFEKKYRCRYLIAFSVSVDKKLSFEELELLNSINEAIKSSTVKLN